MSAVGELVDRKERPAYVRFERLAVEDKRASLEAGHYVARDVDYALITPPYSKDVFKIKVAQWLPDLKQQVHNQRIPQEWADDYEKAYRAWQNGQEMPLKGSPIKGWGVLSPAQQETLIRMNILTVEDLAGINDEGIRRIGMGAVDLKTKAMAWLAQLNDKGPLTQEIAAVKSENAILKSSVETLTRRVEELMAKVKSPVPEEPVVVAAAAISAADILDEPETVTTAPAIETPTPKIVGSVIERYTAKFGKPPHHRMLPATIEAALKE